MFVCSHSRDSIKLDSDNASGHTRIVACARQFALLEKLRKISILQTDIIIDTGRLRAGAVAGQRLLPDSALRTLDRHFCFHHICTRSPYACNLAVEYRAL